MRRRLGAARDTSAVTTLVFICERSMLAMIATWRWDRDDEFPDGRRVGIERTNQLRSRLERLGPDVLDRG
jgi:hypothetical protein